MSLKSTVKVSRVSNLSDARYCAGMGVEMLGFCVIRSQQYYLAPEVFQDIRGWISGPKIIAELYGVSSAEEIQNALQTFSPDYFELSINEYQAFEKYLKLPCIVYCAPSHLTSLLSSENISYILVDEENNCNDISSFSKPVLTKIKTVEKLRERLADGCFHGFALDGGHELRPGFTNYDQLGAILEALEADD